MTSLKFPAKHPSAIKLGGIVMATHHLYNQRNEIASNLSQVTQTPDRLHPWLKMGATVSLSTSLTSMGIAEGASILGRGTISQIATKSGILAMVAYEAFIIADYATGGISRRQFITKQASIAGGLAGTMGGAAAGAAIGGVIAPGIGAAPGAIIGGILGCIAGGSAAQMAADAWYARADEKTQARCDAAVFRAWEVTSY